MNIRSKRKISLKRTLIASALMVLTTVSVNQISQGKNIRPYKPLSTFPKQVGQWVGKETRFDKKIYDILGVDDSFLGNYSTPDGLQVQLYIGFYENQREGDLIHSPRNCLPGIGWNIIQSSIEELIVPNTNPGKVKVNRLVVRKGSQRQVVLYWIQSRGRYISSEYMQKIYLVIDSLTKRRTDGAFVRLISTSTDLNEAETLDYLRAYAKQLIPILQEYIPS
jgi:EpsI family protein